MIVPVRYPFKNFNIEEKDNSLILKPVVEDYDIEQQKLFTLMLNFGYIGFEPGVFGINSKEIISFWEYSKSTILKNYSLEQYYSVLGLGNIYTERIPSIKTEGSFHSNDFRMTVVWIKIDSNMFSSPIAYEQKGLKLRELEFGDTLGVLYPEYFNLYYMIDNANSRWKEWSQKDRYDFLEKLEVHSKLRKIIIPTNLMELLNKHKNEEVQ